MPSTDFPLLPFALFYTLRHTTSPNIIEDTFKETEGYKALKSDFIQLAGTVHICSSGIYNDIDLSLRHSHCVLGDEALSDLINGYSGFGECAIKSPIKTSVEFFFPETGSEKSMASLALTKGFGEGKPKEVKSLELFDDLIFQDVSATGWEVKNSPKRALNITDLQGARVCLQMEMLSFDQINFDRPPVLHNLHMYFGETSPHILFFSAEQLGRPSITKESSMQIQWDFPAGGLDVEPLCIKYEFQIDDQLFFNQLRQLA